MDMTVSEAKSFLERNGYIVIQGNFKYLSKWMIFKYEDSELFGEVIYVHNDNSMDVKTDDGKVYRINNKDILSVFNTEEELSETIYGGNDETI